MIKQPPPNPLPSEKGRLVFFLPGVLGDEPKQEMLRRNLSESIDIFVLQLPEAPEDLVCSLPETGRVVAENLMRLQEKGNINIIGFSFGANLAVEVARHLTSAGRNVGYLGLIDGLLKTDARHSFRGLFDLLTAPRGRLIVSRNILQILKRRFIERIKEKKRVGPTPKPYDAVDWRFIALSRWEPQPCKAQGIMLLSVFNFERSSLVWKRICPNCKQIKIRSDHHFVISGYLADHVASVMSSDLIDYFEKCD